MNVVRATGLLCLLGISVGLSSVFIYRLYTKLFSCTDAKRRRHVSDLGSSVKSANGVLPDTLDVSISFCMSFMLLYNLHLEPFNHCRVLSLSSRQHEEICKNRNKMNEKLCNKISVELMFLLYDMTIYRGWGGR